MNIHIFFSNMSMINDTTKISKLCVSWLKIE